MSVVLLHSRAKPISLARLAGYRSTAVAFRQALPELPPTARAAFEFSASSSTSRDDFSEDGIWSTGGVTDGVTGGVTGGGTKGTSLKSEPAARCDVRGEEGWGGDG
jgi:hypothetical protein